MVVKDGAIWRSGGVGFLFSVSLHRRQSLLCMSQSNAIYDRVWQVSGFWPEGTLTGDYVQLRGQVHSMQKATSKMCKVKCKAIQKSINILHFKPVYLWTTEVYHLIRLNGIDCEIKTDEVI